MNFFIHGSKDKLILQNNLLLRHIDKLVKKREAAHSLEMGGVFSSENLFIRQINKCDKSIYKQLFTDPETTKYIGEVINEDQITTCFNKIISELSTIPVQYITWVVQIKESGESIGILNLALHNNSINSAELEIMLTKDHQNRGYGSELLERFINYFLIDKGISLLFCFALHNNEPVAHILSKFTFKKIKEDTFEKSKLDGCYWVLDRA
jgi:RimJ/RimL family protein N-acetyltransferase